MKLFLSVLLFLTAAGAWGADLTPKVQALADRSVLKGTSWAAMAVYTDGEPLFDIKPDLRLAPASTLKLLTSAAVLDEFGAFYRFETALYADTVPNEQGEIKNLYIRGAGDPTLGSDRVNGSLSWRELLRQWSQEIRQAGVKRITGRIYADVSLFEGPSVPPKITWQNMGNYFAAPATALAFNDNSFDIIFSPQPQHGALMEAVSFSPAPKGLNIRSFVTADAKNRRDNAYVYAAPGQYDLEIYGTLPARSFGTYSISAALPEPPKTLADLLTDTLKEDGVFVGQSPALLYQAPDYPAMHLLYLHRSAPMKDILEILNKRSFNFYAEMLLRMLAVRNGEKGSTQAGVKQLMRFLKKNGISIKNLVLYDASGLSRDNQVTAQTLTDVLTFMSKRPDFDFYYRSLATPQDRGDLLLLRRFLAPFKRIQDVRVKGGTIDGVKAQAGYIKDKNGRLIAFAFIANNLLDKNEDINRFYEELIKLLLSQPEETSPSLKSPSVQYPLPA